MNLREKADEVKRRVTIPDYFNEVIVPDMGWYYNDYESDLNIREVVKCPLHSEDTPSFRYYPETNSYYCWGCASGGDVIKLHIEYMKSKGNDSINFASAVDFLHGVFIEGNISKAQNLTQRKKKVDVENTGREVILYKMEADKIERRLQKDDKMSKETKFIMYKLLDDTEKLIMLSMIRATKATQEIKNMYDRLYKASRKGEKENGL